ncbi:DUF402 domain-containing protein [Actinopolymorpha alba]|uniref:DUF402 domain-containing protein n=1 Tax=Actinopolymorpha alba TaxID=533267 RepID=UPI000379BD61|nr:DUF402 domain-containing protein [Actinopolymorpha alba]
MSVPRTAAALETVHRPSAATYDLNERVDRDRAGTVRAVDTWRVTDFGLYIARPVVDHPRIAWLQSWLLPDLDIRVTDFRGHPGQDRYEDHYVDVLRVTIEGTAWRAVDHYLDILVRTGKDAVVVDSDEFVAAVRAGYLEPPDAEHALETTYRTFAGITANGYDVDAWLRSLGITLTWSIYPR